MELDVKGSSLGRRIRSSDLLPSRSFQPRVEHVEELEAMGRESQSNLAGVKCSWANGFNWMVLLPQHLMFHVSSHHDLLQSFCSVAAQDGR